MAGKISLEGIYRKIAISFIGVTAIGWFLIVVGFGINTSDTPSFRSDSLSYPYWMVCFSGPLVIATAVLHAILWKPISIIIGAVCSFFSVLFITALGMIAYANGYRINRDPGGFPIPDYFSLEFAGAIIGLLFYTPVMVLRHFYDGIKKEKDYSPL